MRKAVLILIALAAVRLLPRALRHEARVLELFTALFQTLLLASANTSKTNSTTNRVTALETRTGTVESTVTTVKSSAGTVNTGTTGAFTDVLTGTNQPSGVVVESSDVWSGPSGSHSTGGNTGGSGAAALNGHTHGFGHTHSVGHTHYTQIQSYMDTLVNEVNAIYTALKNAGLILACRRRVPWQ